MAGGTYVNGPEALAHVIRGEEVGYASELVEEVVLETEDGGWADDGGFGEDTTGYLFTTGLKRLH